MEGILSLRSKCDSWDRPRHVKQTSAGEFDNVCAACRLSLHMAQVFTLKNDQYRRERGGTAVFLSLSCANCSRLVAIYQKDGPGSLVRCYLNRFFYPQELALLHRDPAVSSEAKVPPFRCVGCGTLFGMPMRYRDGRLAYRLVPGTLHKERFDNKQGFGLLQ